MINIIVAASLNNVIGKDNKLLWRQSADLKRFKELTTGKTVVMGRKTYDSIGKPLPNRRNIVITRQDIEIPGCEVVHSLEDALKVDDEIFILGGGEIYQKSIILANKIFLTLIQTEIEGDTYFPQLGDEWIEESKEEFLKDEKNQFDYQFINYVR
jgi:dihydrofolate reductase